MKELLSKSKRWMEVADVLTQILNGDEARYDEMPSGIEKEMMAQETDRIFEILNISTVFNKCCSECTTEVMSPSTGKTLGFKCGDSTCTCHSVTGIELGGSK